MNHPLATDLSDLSDDDLEKRISELTNRYWIARRMNLAENTFQQLDLLLQHYESEREKRSWQNDEASGVWLETDPLPQEKSQDDTDTSPKKFSSVQNKRRRS